MAHRPTPKRLPRTLGAAQRASKAPHPTNPFRSYRTLSRAQHAGRLPGRTKLERTVAAMLRTDEWPVVFAYEDIGLEPGEYVRFARAFVREYRRAR